MEQVSSLATDAQSFLASLSLDVITLIVLTTVLLFIGLRAGKSYLVAFTLSTYPATLILSSFPYKEVIPLEFGLFLGKYDIVNIVLLGIIISAVQIALDYVLEFEYSNAKLKNLANTLILSASGVIALLSALYITGTAKVSGSGGSFLDALFTGEQTLFFLMLLPLIGIFLVAR